MADCKERKRVDYKQVVSELLKRKKLFYIVLPITFVLSAIYIYSIPRMYSTETKMAPEAENQSSDGALSSLASSFGFDLSNVQSNDAITPLLYPELMDDNGFVAGLFDIKVSSKDGKINTTYYDYMYNWQQKTWWEKGLGYVISLFKKKDNSGKSAKFDPYRMNKASDDVANGIKGSIKFTVDKKTGVITIDVKDQDPVICKTVADSVREHLQEFITVYRTRKARVDYEYYKKLTDEAKQTYERSRQTYGSYADANLDVVLESFKSKQNDLENDMQIKFNTYSTLSTQLQAAKAKIQERTPAFTLIKGAAVPIRPDSPKRVMFILTMLVVAFGCTTLYILKDIIKEK